MAQKSFTTHHGMVDILPAESYQWQYIEQLIRELSSQFNFKEIRTPILEQTELIARGVGQLTDIVSKEMFAFSRGDDKYVLRPEGTASVARAYVQHRLDQAGGTQNVYYIGPMFRAERPQKGRQRQFHQFGAEILGSASPLADAEIIQLMMALYTRLGVKNMRLKLNSVGDPESRAAYKTALQDYFRPRLNELSEISRQRFETNPMRILDSKEEEDQALIVDAPVITDFLNEECRTHHGQLKSHLDALGIVYEDAPRLVRGLDYYTKTAFELVSSDLGGQDALGGGGRYDLLIEEIGGRATPAVGFAIGMERLLIVCEALGITLGAPPSPKVYFIYRGEAAAQWSLKKMNELRNLGIKATMDLGGRSMKAQMKDANRENAEFAIITGDEELAQETFTLRNMRDSSEEKLPWAILIKQLIS